jgi:hypothetical protein
MTGYAAISVIRTGRGNHSTSRLTTAVPLCPSQITHGATWDRIWVAVVGSQQLSASDMTRPVS